jgi:hypothetical protein
MKDQEWFSRNAAARYAGVSTATIARWRDSGRLPVYADPAQPKLKRYKRSDLDQLFTPVLDEPRPGEEWRVRDVSDNFSRGTRKPSRPPTSESGVSASPDGRR